MIVSCDPAPAKKASLILRIFSGSAVRIGMGTRISPVCKPPEASYTSGPLMFPILFPKLTPRTAAVFAIKPLGKLPSIIVTHFIVSFSPLTRTAIGDARLNAMIGV